MPSNPESPEKPLIVNLITGSQSQPRANEVTALPPTTAPPSKSSLQIQLLPKISGNVLPTDGIEIENCIGFTSVPLGLAGPLTFNGTHQNLTSLSAPLATGKTNLVASCSRGCKAFSACRGVSASALKDSLARSPVFTFSTVADALEFYATVPAHFQHLKDIAERTTGRRSLVSVSPHVSGTSVHVEFAYAYGDTAARRNWTTLATEAACSALVLEHRPKGLQDVVIEPGTAGARTSAGGSSPEPRGVAVTAWGTVSSEVSEKMLGCSTATLKAALSGIEEDGTRHGHARQGLSTSRIIAAMFISCGQDVASAPESASSHLTGEYDEETEELTLSLFLPSLLVGTVGGATEYPTQKEALEFMGCSGAGKKWALAETIAGFALAAELSTLATGATNGSARRDESPARGLKSKL